MQLRERCIMCTGGCFGNETRDHRRMDIPSLGLVSRHLPFVRAIIQFFNPPTATRSQWRRLQRRGVRSKASTRNSSTAARI